MPNANIIGQTADTSDFEKQSLIQRLVEMVESDKGLYGLNWPGKYAAHNLAYTPTTKTLRPDRAESVNWDSTENLFITGDNLEILKLLRTNYANQIDMIYIDPPYNTGGNDFVYKDDFSDTSNEYQEKTEQLGLVSNPKTAGRRHSNWLSMMFSRLLIAKELLKDTGVIFISIDDNELANLKLLCDEIFGEGNFVGQWNWYKSETPPNLSLKIKKNIEYILCYEKSKNSDRFSGLKKESNSDDPFTKPQNTIKELRLSSGSINVKGEKKLIPKGIYGTKKYPNELLNDIEVENGKNKNIVIFKNRFVWTQEKLETEISSGTTINLSSNGVLSYKKTIYDPEVPPNFISADIGNTNENAGRDLIELLGGDYFDYPKPIDLLKYILNFKSDENAIILDFFAGSGTTAHAVEKLNAEDKKARKWILCQIDEPCEKENFKSIDQISRERIRRVGASFRALKLDTSNYTEQFYTPTDWTKHKQLELLKEFIKTDRSIEDICFGIMLEQGLPLTAKISKTDYGVYAESDNKLLFVVNKKLDTNTARELAENIKKRANSKEAIIYIYPDNFIDDATKINCMQFFENVENLTLMEL